jgi:hypothetical protein
MSEPDNVNRIEYGVRTSFGEGSHVIGYGTDRAEAERIANRPVVGGQGRAVVKRAVAVSKWTDKRPTAAEWADGLPERLVRVAELALIDHTPGDEHTDAAARKVVAAVLRALTRADCPKTLTAIDIRFWANDAENAPAASSAASTKESPEAAS